MHGMSGNTPIAIRPARPAMFNAMAGTSEYSNITRNQFQSLAESRYIWEDSLNQFPYNTGSSHALSNQSWRSDVRAYNASIPRFSPNGLLNVEHENNGFFGTQSSLQHLSPSFSTGNRQHSPFEPGCSRSRLLAAGTADYLGSSLSSTPSTPNSISQVPDDLVAMDGCENVKNETPYAKLIYEALMAAPEHRLVLRDIYDWIRRNTEKAKDPGNRGWQNSVRHNLSMNGAFIKQEHFDPVNKSKKGYIWVLEPSAIERGIESTTRYRHKAVGKKIGSRGLLDQKRQRSGRKGSTAACKFGRLRRSMRLDGITSQPNSPTGIGCLYHPSGDPFGMEGPPYYLPPTSHSAPPGLYPYVFGDPTDAVIKSEQPLFCDSFSSGGEHVNEGAEDRFLGSEIASLVTST